MAQNQSFQRPHRLITKLRNIQQFIYVDDSVKFWQFTWSPTKSKFSENVNRFVYTSQLLIAGSIRKLKAISKPIFVFERKGQNFL